MTLGSSSETQSRKPTASRQLFLRVLLSRVLQSIHAMATEPLSQLSPRSAGVGAWMLIVASNPRKIEYQWNKNGKSGTGHKLEVVLMSEDSTQYCEGVFKKKGKEPAATKDLDAAKNKFKKDTNWKLSKASLTNESPTYVGSSCKVVIDMRNSTFDPVLQSTE